jgi:TonB family protein
MSRILRLSAVLFLGLAASLAAAAEPPVRARSLQPLASYFTDADYPDAAIRNFEQGAVGFRLTIAPDGRPSGCSVTSSSGSAILDSTTCRIVVERPRFEPARDAHGKATSDEVDGRIVWRLPDEAGEPDPRVQAAVTLWAECVRGEAAKLTTGALPAGEVARRSFAPCAALEAPLLPPGEQADALAQLRGAMAPLIEAMVLRTRAIMADPAPPEVRKEP